ncbi:aromatic amino acid transaminase [Paraglaciecola marina]|uniref:aromatic amino acid transaminase n=1 Tax=Paraglaciecola marina TaxID=2500157 RepID=UPI00106177DC|nr:aromatic amino acid transaminase [Paraglaciecola marina]
MFSKVETVGRDLLWKLTEDYKNDSRDVKLDLILGVYKDQNGNTPVMSSVKKAELDLVNNQMSKVYRPLTGNSEFNKEIKKLVLGTNSHYLHQSVAVQTVGGTGALRMLADMIYWSRPNATVWVSKPGYVNHEPIMRAAGLNVKYYPWIENNNQLDLGAFTDAIGSAKKRDIILIQGCCHNPTGIDPTQYQWDEISELFTSLKVIPLIDIAYQGLGNGIDEDAKGLRTLVDALDVCLISTSCSKNMSMYCDRVGAAIITSKDNSQLNNISSMMEQIARRAYSMPPEHGAAVALSLMQEPRHWLEELNEIRNRILHIRSLINLEFEKKPLLNNFMSIKNHNGMFSMLPISQENTQRLKIEQGVYCTNEGRINISGLTNSDVTIFVNALENILLSSEH